MSKLTQNVSAWWNYGRFVGAGRVYQNESPEWKAAYENRLAVKVWKPITTAVAVVSLPLFFLPVLGLGTLALAAFLRGNILHGNAKKADEIWAVQHPDSAAAERVRVRREVDSNDIGRTRGKSAERTPPVSPVAKTGAQTEARVTTEPEDLASVVESLRGAGEVEKPTAPKYHDGGPQSVVLNGQVGKESSTSGASLF